MTTPREHHSGAEDGDSSRSVGDPPVEDAGTDNTTPRVGETDQRDRSAKSGTAPLGIDVSPVGLDSRQRRLVGGGVVLIVLGYLLPFAFAVQFPGGLLGLSGLVLFLAALGTGLYIIFQSSPLRRTPAVERRQGISRTGESLDTTLEAIAESDATRPVHRNVRQRLRRLVVDVLVAERDTETSEANERVADGSWTDDERAASLLLEDTADADQTATVPATKAAVESLAARVLGPGEYSPTVGDSPESRDKEWPRGQYRTRHWRGLGTLILFAVSFAVLFESVGLFLVAGTLVGVAGYSRLGRVPSPSIGVQREFEPTDPRPGEDVTVTVTVTNESDEVVTDLRLVDVVPERLAVTDGSPRHAVSLAAGDTTTFSYDVLAVYGTHEFDAMHVAVRDTSGEQERTETRETSTTVLTCEPRLVQDTVPLHPQTSGFVGRVPSDTGGGGQEFRSVREYRRGDPARRVDWNRLARTGELSTLEFRADHAATVVVLVDTRTPAACARSQTDLSAIDRSTAGAAQLVATLQSDGDRVGLATVGPEWLWIGPGAGHEHRTRIRSTLKSDPVFVARDWERAFRPSAYVRRLRRRLPADAQLVLFSPLLDDDVVTVARRLHAHGHALTVFSPDPTSTETVGTTAARIRRQLNLEAIRASDIRIVDWPFGDPLDVAVERSKRRWRL